MVANEGSGAKSQITALTDVNNIQRKKDEASKLVERRLTRRFSLIDTEEKIRRALPALREMVSEGLVAMTDVEVLHHTSGEGKK
jgi:PII-like signaling protein